MDQFFEAKQKILDYFAKAAGEWSRLRPTDYELARARLGEKCAARDILRLIGATEVEIEQAERRGTTRP